MVPRSTLFLPFRLDTAVLLCSLSVFAFQITYADITDNEGSLAEERLSLGETAASIQPPMGWRTASSSNNALLLLLPPDSAHGASLNAFLNTTANRDLDELKNEIQAKRSAGNDNWKLLGSERMTIDNKQSLIMTYAQDVVERTETKRCVTIGCFIVVDDGLYVLNFNCLETGFESLGPTAKKSLISFAIKGK